MQSDAATRRQDRGVFETVDLARLSSRSIGAARLMRRALGRTLPVAEIHPFDYHYIDGVSFIHSFYSFYLVVRMSA